MALGASVPQSSVTSTGVEQLRTAPPPEPQSQPQATAVDVGTISPVLLAPSIAPSAPPLPVKASVTAEAGIVTTADVPSSEPVKQADSTPTSPPQTQTPQPQPQAQSIQTPADRHEITPVKPPATVFHESEPSSAWANLSEAENKRGGVVSDNTVGRIDTITTDEEAAAETGGGRKAFPNLAALAASVILQRKPNTPVRYYTQVDMQSVAFRRRRFGKRGFDFHLRLEGSELIVTRRPRKKAAAAAIAAASGETSAEPTLSIDATSRIVVNVRSEQVYVDAERCELVIHRKDRDRAQRLSLKSPEICARWESALRGARECHIDSFYRLGGTLGRGAYGEVVEGFDVHTDVKRAVKIVKRGTTPKSIEHLSRELDVMRSVSHHGIVQTYQIFAGRTIYIVMEYVPGGDLFDFVASHEVLTEAQGAQTMRSILSAVAYLHSTNIVHRDLKPENILCRTKSWPLETKITDFGFSTVLDPIEDSVMRTPVGTAYFMAPEIITHKGHGPPVDIWACGIILYTILTGRLPFPGRNRDEYFRNVSRGRVLFPPSLWKGISEDALNLVKGMLCQDPKKRLTALGVLQHKWITSPRGGEDDRGIKRNRTNLHSKRRRLYKARSAIIAVAMAQKFKATALVDLVEKMPGGFEKMKEGTARFAHKTADSVMNQGDKLGEGTKKLAENVGEGTKKFAGNVGEGVKKAGEGTKKFAEKAGGGMKKAGQNMGEGVKKTGEGIRKGAGKAADGVKKTGQGVKKASKKGAEKMKIDKTKLEKLKLPIENFMQKFDGTSNTATQSHSSGDPTGAGGGGNKKKDGLKKKLRALVHSELNPTESQSQSQAQGEVEKEHVDTDDAQTAKPNVVELDDYGREVASAEPNVSAMAMPPDTTSPDAPPSLVVSVTRQSSPRATGSLVSNVTNRTDPEVEAEAKSSATSKPAAHPDTTPHAGTIEQNASQVSGGSDAIEKHSSQVSSDAGTSTAGMLTMRPKLTPLRLGLGAAAVDTDAYAHSRTPPSRDHDARSRSSDEDESGEVHKLRKTAALLLMASEVSDPHRVGEAGAGR